MIDDYSKRSRLFHYEHFCLHSDLVSLDDTGSPFVYFIREDIFDSWDQHPEPDVTISLRKYLGYRV
jgi:hypothetical protein